VVAHHDEPRLSSKAHFSGYRRPDSPHQNCVDISFSRHLMERPQFLPARAEAVSLPSGTTPVNEHASPLMSESGHITGLKSDIAPCPRESAKPFA
jgi:hypothetical protein